MKFQTKFWVGQEAWFIYEGKIFNTTIEEIIIREKSAQSGLYVVSYYAANGGTFKTDEFYATKEEAKAALIANVAAM